MPKSSLISRNLVLALSASGAVCLLTGLPSYADTGLLGVASGSVYTCTDCLGAFTSPPTGPVNQVGTFTATTIDFFTPPGSANEIGDFLGHASGTTFTATGGTPSDVMSTGGNLNKGMFIEITGQMQLDSSSASFKFPHDDGVELIIDPGLGQKIVYSDPNPTQASPSQIVSFLGQGISPGLHSFEILYDEVNGAPAQLSFPTGSVAVPGPIPGTGLLSFLALGILGFFSAARKRMGPQPIG